MSHVSHVRMVEEDEEHRDGRGGGDLEIGVQGDDAVTSSGIGTPPSERHEAQPPLSLTLGDSPHITAVVSPLSGGLNRRSIMQRRWRILSVILSAVGLVGATVAVTRFSNSQSDSIEKIEVGATSFDLGTGSGQTAFAASSSSMDIEDFDFASSSGDESDSGVRSFLKFHQQSSGASVFELSKALWNESFVVYPTVARHSAPQMNGLERGSILLETTDHVFHFEKPVDGSNFLVLVQDYYYAKLGDASDELRTMVEDSQWPGHLAKVPIYMETDDSFFIPSDPFLGSGFFVSSLLALSADYTPVAGSAASYPRNTNFQVEYETQYGIVIVNYAIGVLPEEVMPQRVADDRVGYFSLQYTRFGVNEADKGKDGFHVFNPLVNVINRRRLEVDPVTGTVKNPVKYYIDPSVPVRWRQAFAAGVEAWKPAFEQIGLINAIKAVLPSDPEWPEDYRIGDLRYNSISVMISDQTYALGPHVMDPRSGEILHSDIIFEYGFFNKVMMDFDLLSPVNPPEEPVQPVEPPAADPNPGVDGPNSISEVFKTSNRKRAFRSGGQQKLLSPMTHPSGENFQCGLAHGDAHAIDRFQIGMLLLSGQTKVSNHFVPDAIVAQLFIDIVMHEVGHTLGLRHNFAASTAFTREQLNNASFVKKNGVASSVMDYVPANIFSDLTAEEAATHEFYSTVVGSYDLAAVAYGYAAVADEVPGDKSPGLTALAERAPLFLSDESVDMLMHPYAQRYDLSADPIDYAVDRLVFIEQARNSTWMSDKLPEDAPVSVLWRRERTLLRIVNQSIDFVTPLLGGVNVTHAHHHAGQAPYKAPYVPRETQLRALDVLARIIAADGENSALFPAPGDYAQFVEAQGYGEDCNAPSLSYSCLGRGIADVGAAILEIRKTAVLAALFPALDRIVAQDAASPLSIEDILLAIETAALSADQSQPRNQALLSFFHRVLQSLVDLPSVDSRIKSVISAMFPQISPAPVVRNKALRPIDGDE
jgi:hypothetical protein